MHMFVCVGVDDVYECMFCWCASFTDVGWQNVILIPQIKDIDALSSFFLKKSSVLPCVLLLLKPSNVS